MSKPTKKDKEDQLTKELDQLTADLQRVQADFINYRRRVEEERKATIETAKAATITKLLPVVDNIERAIAHVPVELANNAWAQGVVSLGKNLEKSLSELGLVRIEGAPGTLFDPNLHEAIGMDDSEGDEEVISEELRAGYRLGHQVVRPSMVKVTHRPAQPEHRPEKIVEAELETEPLDQEKSDD